MEGQANLCWRIEAWKCTSSCDIGDGTSALARPLFSALSLRFLALRVDSIL
jgi:hypothetical protein